MATTLTVRESTVMLIHLYNTIMSVPLQASTIYTFIITIVMIIIASPPSKYSSQDCHGIRTEKTWR
jgi:hypothetical protein